MPTDLISGQKSSDTGPVDLLESVDTFTDNMSVSDTPEKTQDLLARSEKNDLPSDMSFLYEQTKDKSDFLGGISVLAQTLQRLPEEQAMAVLKMHAGAEAASVTDKGWMTRVLKSSRERSEQFSQGIYKQYGDTQIAPFVPIKITDVGALGQNIAFSTTSMITGLGAAAPLILVPEPTLATKVAAWGVGTVASGKAAYEMATYDIMQSYLEAQNEIEPLTPETERDHKKFFNAAAQQYGLWEAVPEALSNMGFAAILTKPLSKMVGKSVAAKIVKKMGAMYGQEIITEAITQWGQARVEEKAGLREPGEGQISFVEAIKEVAPQTFLLTTFMAGAGSSAIAIKNKVRESFANETKGKEVAPEVGGLLDEFVDDIIGQQVVIQNTIESNKKQAMTGVTPSEIDVVTPKDLQTPSVEVTPTPKAVGLAPALDRKGQGDLSDVERQERASQNISALKDGDRVRDPISGNIYEVGKDKRGINLFNVKEDGSIDATPIAIIIDGKGKTTDYENLEMVNTPTPQEGGGITVYHGTNTKFEGTPSLNKDGSLYFTEDKNYAKSFADKDPNYSKIFEGKLNVKSPANLVSLGVKEMTPKKLSAMLSEQGIKISENALSKDGEEGDIKQPLWFYLRITPELRTAIKTAGYDSATFMEKKQPTEKPNKSWIVFDKESFISNDNSKLTTLAEGEAKAVKPTMVNESEKAAVMGEEGAKTPIVEPPADDGKVEPELLTELKSIQEKINEYNARGERVPDSLLKRQQAIVDMQSGEKAGKPITKVGKPAQRKYTLNEMTLLKERLKNISRGAREGAKFAKDVVAKVQEDVIDLLESADILPKDRAKFIRTIKNIQTEEQFADALPEIVSRVEKIEAAKRTKDALKQKQRDLKNAIKAKRFQRTEAFREALKLPDIDKMTTEQISEFEAALEPYHEGDIFLTQRQIETVDNTDLAGIRTLREARVKLAEQAGVPVEELMKIKVSEFDRFREDVALSEQNPLYKILVEETHRGFIGADLKFRNFERELDQLTIKARRSQERSVADRLVQTDDLVFQWLESSDKATVEENMTPEELELAVFLEKNFAEALEYLIRTKALKTGRDNYITNVRRGFFEALKADGLMTAAKEMLDQYKQDSEIFNILDQQTGNVLPLEKFFQFAMRRTGGIKPTKNVAKAASVYFQTLYKKQALDAIVPKMMIYAQSVTPGKVTPLGLEFDQSIKNFMKEWINTKKGRKTKLFIKQGGAMDAIVSGGRALVTIMDLGLNIPVGIAANVGEAVAGYVTLGKGNMAKGMARLATPKGRQIVDKYEGFTGKSLWRELLEPAKNIGDKTMTALFGLFASSTTRMNKISLLGLMTEQEYNSGAITDQRLTEIKLQMGRMRIISGGKSIIGATTEGGILTQYKSWAIPILRTVSADLVNFAKKIKGGDALSSDEFVRIGRGLEITTAALIFGAMVGDNDDDDSFLGQLLKKARRESLTILGAIDPAMFLGEPRFFEWVAKLGEALSLLVTLERYKKSGKLKGVKALQGIVTPRALSMFFKDDEAGSKRIPGKPL
jgi:hypothetical protein